MALVEWTKPALRDLTAIEGWLSANRPEAVTVRTLNRVMEKADMLRNFPALGRPAGSARVLCVVNTPYLILYRIKGNAIQILRVGHERQDRPGW